MSQMVRIERVPRDKLPPGSKVLTGEEVLNHYFDMVQKWKPASEVWPIKYGWALLGIASCTANFFILKQYRQRLKLTGGIYASLTMGCAIVPSIFAPIGHIYYVTKNIFTRDECMGCLHIRSVALQLGTSLLYGLTVNPALCFLKAQHLATYNVPGYNTPEQRRKMWQLYVKFTRRASRSIYLHSLINSLAATAVTAGEIKSFIKMNEKLVQKNKEVDELRKTLPQ